MSYLDTDESDTKDRVEKGIVSLILMLSLIGLVTTINSITEALSTFDGAIGFILGVVLTVTAIVFLKIGVKIAVNSN